MKRSRILYGKKLLLLLILLLLVLSLLNALSLNMVRVSAGDYPAIYVEPATIENATLTPGTNFTVSIKTDYNGSNVWGYEDVTLTYNPLVLQGARIPKTDTWTGDNVTKLFFTTNKIIVPGSEEVYVNQTLMTRGPDYTIDYQTGKITFTTAPGEVEVKITYLYYGVTNGDLITGPLAMFISAGFDDTLGKLGRTSNGFFLTNTVTSGPGTLANATFTVVGKGATNITLGPETRLVGRAPPDYYPYTIPTNTQHGYFDNRFPHDVAVVSVAAQAEATVGNVSIDVEVVNFGKSDEEVEVAVSYDSVPIGTEQILVFVGESETALFSWNTAGLVQGSYAINATATILEDDDPTDNWKTTTFLLTHDIAVVSVTAPDKAPVESLVPISVEVVNIGSLTEVANVTVRYDLTIIGFKDTVMIPVQNSTIVRFDWETTGVAVGTYTINATATIGDDGDPTDNWKNTTIFLVAGDVAVVNVTAPDKAPVESLVPISVEVANEGAFLVVANVTVRYDLTIIGFNDTVELPVGESRTVLFSWNTTGLAQGNYTLNATARLMNKTDAWTALGINNTDAWTALGINNTDMWAGDGVNTTFTTTGKPIIEDSEKVYVNQTLMTKPANYTIDYEMGNITFTTAPELGANVTAIYSYLKKSFVTTQKPVVPDSEKVYVNQTLMTKPANYTIDYEAGNITFTTAPGFGAEIKAIYLPVDTDPTDNWNTTTILIVEHDVAIISLDAPAEAAVGDIVPINVNITNIGSSDENVTLTVSYAYEHPSEPPPTVIDTRNFTINIGLSETVSFSWNTTGLAQGNYTLNATATIPRDDDPTDNWNTTKITLKCHDIEVISVKPSPHKVFVGELVDITVEVKNVGDYNETFKVKVSYNTNTIRESQQIELSLGNSTTLSFKWNTTGVAPALYMIWAEAILEADVDPKNNKRGYPAIVELPLGTIVGKVTDVSTDLPIPEANITAGDYSATTDAEGHYNITDVPAGTYNVTASKTGYESASQLNIIVVAGETTPVNFTLRVSSTITISADPTTITVGERTTISGSIDPTREGVTVTIWYRLSGEEAWTNLTNVTTNENSQYSYVWTPEAAGTYEVKASWLGDDYTSPAESDGQTVTVKEAPTPGFPWHIYMAAAGVVAIAMVAIAFYFLRIRKPKPT